jgi:hypothetical protein
MSGIDVSSCKLYETHSSVYLKNGHVSSWFHQVTMPYIPMDSKSSICRAIYDAAHPLYRREKYSDNVFITCQSSKTGDVHIAHIGQVHSLLHKDDDHFCYYLKKMGLIESDDKPTLANICDTQMHIYQYKSHPLIDKTHFLGCIHFKPLTSEDVTARDLIYLGTMTESQVYHACQASHVKLHDIALPNLEFSLPLMERYASPWILKNGFTEMMINYNHIMMTHQGPHALLEFINTHPMILMYDTTSYLATILIQALSKEIQAKIQH